MLRTERWEQWDDQADAVMGFVCSGCISEDEWRAIRAELTSTLRKRFWYHRAVVSAELELLPSRLRWRWRLALLDLRDLVGLDTSAQVNALLDELDAPTAGLPQRS